MRGVPAINHRSALPAALRPTPALPVLLCRREGDTGGGRDQRAGRRAGPAAVPGAPQPAPPHALIHHPPAAGVADQLQTNFASDMRSILKTVFKIEKDGDSRVTDAPRVADCPLCSSPAEAARLRRAGARPLPEWVPDSTCSQCSACRSPFTLLRRRHHCRSCGRIFCARCSPNTAVLPYYSQSKPVRVCTHCYSTHLPDFHSDGSGCLKSS
uniref:FYVE-type domain-containing protein n=1 Tax=Junco hyemalis TaxID=40217 RepID=A0A8C5IM24_JUNHY